MSEIKIKVVAKENYCETAKRGINA